MNIKSSRQSTSQKITATHSNTLAGVVESCFLLPSETPSRQQIARAFLEVAPGFEYVLGSRDDVLIRCELAGMHFLEVRTLKALQLIQTIADINDYCLSENEILILQHNLYVYGSCTPWYPDLSWLTNSMESGA